jgi:hypothetical protein
MIVGPWQGSQRAVRIAGIAGLVGLLLTAIGGFAVDPRRALFAYLVAFLYWIGIAIGALILLGSLHASNARWSVVLRRFLESVPAVLPLFVVLFIPIVLGREHLYPWTSTHLEGELAHAVEHKRPWLNLPFFLVRAAIYFAVWIGVGFLLRRWSVEQDETGALGLTRRQRALGAASLPFLALTMTFAGFDWMMSLDPRFYSTIFGVYWWAGSFVCAFAVIIIAATSTRDDPAGFGRFLNVEHFHSLGKFMLAFVAFWAYMAFSQFMLIWIANIPEEVPWYVLRIDHGWRGVFAFLVLFNFLVPLFVLFSRDLKRDPRRLSYVAAWLLFTHWIDLYWVIMPHLDATGPRPSLWDLAAFVGVGGVAIAFGLLRMRGVASVPVRDPYLDDSLRYLPQ